MIALFASSASHHATSASTADFTVTLVGLDEPDLIDQGDGLTITKTHSGSVGVEYETEGWTVTEWRYLRRGARYKLTVTNGSATDAATTVTCSVNLLPFRTSF